MDPNMEPARGQTEGALRQQLAARVAIGANLAGLLPDRRPAALRRLAEVMLAEGEEPYSQAEACLIVRIAKRRPDLQDPAAVDLSDPATQEVARQLADVWRCIEARAQARAEAEYIPPPELGWGSPPGFNGWADDWPTSQQTPGRGPA
jgi:hypothetical protein